MAEQGRWHLSGLGDSAQHDQVPGGGWIVQAKDPQDAAFALLGA